MKAIFASGGQAAWHSYWSTLSSFLVARASKGELDDIVLSILPLNQGSS